MKRTFAAVVALAAVPLAAQSATPAPAPATQDLRDAVPADAKMEQFALSPDGLHSYFVNTAGEVWLYDRTQKTRARITGAGVSDLNLSPARDALAYTKVSGNRGDANVWVIKLNPETGLAVGTERQLSTGSGDVPSISPDGKFVAYARDDANGVGQSIVVVPVSGGNERVVAPTLPSSVGNIRWTPDGKRLYFGVNAPVACVPEWSCLPLAGANRQPPGSIRRVAANGGAVSMVAAARGVFPGLSPDGTTLMFIDTGATRRWVVADTNGTRRNAITLTGTQAAYGWLKGSMILVASSGNTRSLRLQALAEGAPRTLMDNADQALDPQWSPDGKIISIMARGTPHSELRLLNSDGVLQKTLALPDNFAFYSTWSPDGRYIAFMGFGETPPPHLSVIEVATGRVTRLGDLNQENQPSLRWQGDSRGLVIAELLGSGKDRHASFRQVDLTGKASALRDIALGPMPSFGLPVDATSALVLRANPAEVRVTRLSGDTTEHTILPERPGAVAMPSVSGDGTWLVLRRHGDTPQSSVLEVARLDGSQISSIPLPFVASNARVAPGGKEVVVIESPKSDVDAGVYLVTVATRAVRKLFMYAPRFGPPEMTVSPDGRSLVYFLWQTLPPGLQAMDVSTAKSGTAK